MNAKQLTPDDGTERTWALVLESGEDPVSCLESFAADQRLSAARITAIGAFSRATLGWFDWEEKTYREIPIDEQVELLALVGDIALEDEQPSVHAHVVVGKSDGSAHGGHLLGATVRPTMEIVITESPAHLRERHDPESGLALIAPD
jgi:predicted DNA-binding protein with PD1-like motif